ncbi:MAG: GtrA family protein [Pseudomonadota bacterium]
MIALIRKLAKFGAVGVIGAVVDIGLLLGLIALGAAPLAGRALSLPAAMFVTWRLNRRFTFGASGRSAAQEGARYAAVAFTAAGVNYAVFAGLMLAWPGLEPALAVVAATLVSMWTSFIGYQRFAFGRRAAA